MSLSSLGGSRKPRVLLCVKTSLVNVSTTRQQQTVLDRHFFFNIVYRLPVVCAVLLPVLHKLLTLNTSGRLFLVVRCRSYYNTTLLTLVQATLL